MNRYLWIMTYCLVGITAMCSLHAAPADFRLTDYLGRNWQHEPVTFPLTAAQLQQVKAGRALQGAGGQNISYQLITGATDRDARIAFIADLPPYATRAFTFTDARVDKTSDLKVTETADTIECVNSKTGICIAKKLAAGQGPIAGIRLPSGAWVTGSRLATDQPITRYSAEVVARGSVFTEVVAQMTIGKTATWEQRYRIYADEPVVLVDETSAVDGPVATLSLDFQRDFNPDSLLFRYGKPGAQGSYNKNVVEKITPGQVFLMVPWLRWNQRERQGNYFGLFREDGNDVLAIAAREGSAWVEPIDPATIGHVPLRATRTTKWIEPAIPAGKQASYQIQVTQDERGLLQDFPLKVGRRKWMYIALPKEPCLVETKDEKIAYRSPLPYQYLIKHGHFPLDMVKDYVLDWDADKDSHPRLLFTQKDVDRFRAGLTPQEKAAYQADVLACLAPIGEFAIDRPARTYLATRDEKLGQHIITTALDYLENGLKIFFDQEEFPYGSAPHMSPRVVLPAMLLTDLALQTGQATPEQKKRLLAHAAFIGYALNRPEYWSPERGYVATPNMTSMVACYRATAGALFPSHPCSKAWLDNGVGELKYEVDHWSDDNGGWLEAPHYALVSYDLVLSGLIMAYHARGDETIFSPRVRRVMEWLGKITSPPDSRLGGFRHLPPIGNTYMNEPTGEFGVLAKLWKDRDPEFSAQMQWLWLQHRSLKTPGIGGPYPGTDSYRSWLIDPTLPAKAPIYGSELFPKTGVILRNVFPSDRETTLHMIAGPNHDHYDLDSGSITLYGKGRILCDDYGYYGCTPADEHNLIESPAISNEETMTVTAFEPADRLDYVRGTLGIWTRQIAFVKRPDPLAPNYFVLCDSLAKPAPMHWHTWFTAANVLPNAHGAVVEGKEDVDTDAFIVSPANTTFTTGTKSARANCGMDERGNVGAMTTTQLGLVAKLPQATQFTVVLYPRLKAEVAPVCTPIAGGNGVKIQTPVGIDYVFLSPTPFTYTEGDITFRGTAGSIQATPDGPQLTLGASGHIAIGKQELTRE